MDELGKACRVMRHYEADIVSAYRFDRTGEGYVRVVYSAIYNALVRVLFGVRMRDINFAFKLTPPARARPRCTLASEGSFIDAELIVRAIGPRLQGRAVRRRLLPPHPGGVDAQLAGRHRQAPAGDVHPAKGAARHRPAEARCERRST